MTAKAAEIVALAARVEQATGADRELDGAIDRLFNERPVHGDYDEKENAFWRVAEPWCGLLVRANGFARGSFCAASYTASLDAAMTLVPEGSFWELDAHSRAKVTAEVRYGSGDDVWFEQETFEADAATPALALTAATLRALASQITDQPQQHGEG